MSLPNQWEKHLTFPPFSHYIENNRKAMYKIMLEYQFNHNSVYGQPPSGFYGESNFFEVKPGQENLEVQVPLNAAI